MNPLLEERLNTLSCIDREWPSFNWSQYRAERALRDYIVELERRVRGLG